MIRPVIFLLFLAGCGAGVEPIAFDAGPFQVTHAMICLVQPGWDAEQTQLVLGPPCSGGLSDAPPFAVYGRWGVPDCSSAEVWQVNFDEPAPWELVQVGGAPDPCDSDAGASQTN